MRARCQQLLPDGSYCLRVLYACISKAQGICGVCARERMQQMGARFNGRMYTPPIRVRGKYAGVFH